MLQSSINIMQRKFYEILQCDYILSWKLTVSSYSNYSSNVYLARNLAPAFFFCNNPRIYSILKNAQRGGICFVQKSNCGDIEAENLAQLLKEQFEGQDIDEQHYSEAVRAAIARARRASEGTHEERLNYVRRLNSHLLDNSGGEEASYLTALDITAKYLFCYGKCIYN